MLRLTIECFDKSAEIYSMERTHDGIIEYCIKPMCDGFISIKGESYKLKDGICKIDASKIKEKELNPLLILSDKRVGLPPLIYDEEEYKIKAYDADFMRKISLEELRIAKRLLELEKRVDNLSKRVYNTTIFKF